MNRCSNLINKGLVQEPQFQKKEGKRKWFESRFNLLQNGSGCWRSAQPDSLVWGCTNRPSNNGCGSALRFSNRLTLSNFRMYYWLASQKKGSDLEATFLFLWGRDSLDPFFTVACNQLSCLLSFRGFFSLSCFLSYYHQVDHGLTESSPDSENAVLTLIFSRLFRRNSGTCRLYIKSCNRYI